MASLENVTRQSAWHRVCELAKWCFLDVSWDVRITGLLIGVILGRILILAGVW